MDKNCFIAKTYHGLMIQFIQLIILTWQEANIHNSHIKIKIKTKFYIYIYIYIYIYTHYSIPKPSLWNESHGTIKPSAKVNAIGTPTLIWEAIFLSIFHITHNFVPQKIKIHGLFMFKERHYLLSSVCACMHAYISY